MIDCKLIAAEHKERLKKYMLDNHLSVGLAVIQVGDNPASNSYIKGKKSDCAETNINFYHIKFDNVDTVTTEDVISEINCLNNDKEIQGIIVQLPLPRHLDQAAILDAIVDEKDVDGFKASSKFTPCTPKGMMMILDHLGIDVDGKVCCVIGRGEVGKPMVDLLIQHNATVLWCNSHTPEHIINKAVDVDVLITATGHKGLIQYVPLGMTVIDVGISRGDDGKLYGDVDRKCYEDYLNITPVPGGVGLMTRVALLENTVYGGT